MNWYIYDYFNQSPAQQYWRGQIGGLPPSEVRDVLKHINLKFGSIKSNAWANGDYIGGLFVADSYAAIYRLYNGGRDEAGRPHRWVLLMACGDVKDLEGLDVIGALSSPAFELYGSEIVASVAPMPALAASFSGHCSNHGCPVKG